MNGFLVVLLLMLLFGMFQGFTVCNLTCGPLLILRLAGQARGAREGFGLSLLFSLPRVITLTFLGALLGAAGYSTSALAELSSISWFSGAVYIMIGLIMIATGLVFIMRRERMKEACSRSRKSMKDRILGLILKLGPGKGKSEGRSMMGLGILISLICFVEASGASVAVSGLVGMDASTIGTGVLFGALTMLFYSVGLSIPLLVIGAGASELGRRLNTEDVRAVVGLLLILIGVIIIGLETYLILS